MNMNNSMSPEQAIRWIGSSFKALIFDLDGTLTDSNPAHLEAWTRACNAFGLTYPREKFYFFAGLSSLAIAEEIIRMYGKEGILSPKDLSDRKEREFDKLEDQVKIIEPVFSIVRHFHGKLPMAVGTGRRKSSALKTMKHLRLSRYFDVLVTADDVVNHKPKPDTFLVCAAKMGVAPKDCLVFEDASRGLEAARNAGMKVFDVTIWHPAMDL